MCCLQGNDAPKDDAPVDTQETSTAVFVTERRGKSRTVKRKLCDPTPVTAEVHMHRCVCDLEDYVVSLSLKITQLLWVFHVGCFLRLRRSRYSQKRAEVAPEEEKCPQPRTLHFHLKFLLIRILWRKIEKPETPIQMLTNRKVGFDPAQPKCLNNLPY